jgi:hypothetical protein
LFAKIVDEVPWHAERRQMYARVVDVPRLLSFYDEDEPLPHPVLDAARTALSRQYDEDLREPFRTAGLCYYQTGGTAWPNRRGFVKLWRLAIHNPNSLAVVEGLEIAIQLVGIRRLPSAIAQVNGRGGDV